MTSSDDLHVSPTQVDPRSPTRRALAVGWSSACGVALIGIGSILSDPPFRSLIALGVALLLFGRLLENVSPTFSAPSTEANLSAERFATLLGLLERIALALEAAERSPASAPNLPDDLVSFREALRSGDWDRASELSCTLAARAGHPTIVEELAQAKLRRFQALVAELKASREVNDPERALAIHEELGEVGEPEPLREVEQESAKWFLKLIMRRMRTGTVRGDVADLATRVAERFAWTMEGASLRASLPTLRRSAGMCPKCGRPYAGLGNACPLCVASSPSSAEVTIVEEPSEEIGPE